MKKKERQEQAIRDMIAAAHEIKRVNDAQVAYTRELMRLSAEAARAGVSQSHRLPDPVVHDYGNGIVALLEALRKYES